VSLAATKTATTPKANRIEQLEQSKLNEEAISRSDQFSKENNSISISNSSGGGDRFDFFN
jgi:hypothetical protein